LGTLVEFMYQKPTAIATTASCRVPVYPLRFRMRHSSSKAMANTTSSSRPWAAFSSRRRRVSVKPKSSAPRAVPIGFQLPKIMVANPM